MNSIVAPRRVFQGAFAAILLAAACSVNAGRITDISDHARVENRFYQGERDRWNDRPHRRHGIRHHRGHGRGHYRYRHWRDDEWEGWGAYWPDRWTCWPFQCLPVRRWDSGPDWDDDGYLDFTFHYRGYGYDD